MRGIDRCWKQLERKLGQNCEVLIEGYSSLFFPKQTKGVKEMGNLLNNSKLFLKRNGSTILTCVGGAGVVATTVMAVKATPKALLLLEEAKKEKGEELTKVEVVKVAGPAYIPTAVMGVSTIACVFGANVLNKRKQAALTSAYALLNESYKEYRAKVVDLYGEEVDTHVKKEIAKDKYKDSDIQEEDGKELYYDDFSGRYFNATAETVHDAEYGINRLLSTTGAACANEFYGLLKIDPIDGGDELGWSIGGLEECTWSPWLDFFHEKVVMDDGLECTIIRASSEPMIDYEYY